MADHWEDLGTNLSWAGRYEEGIAALEIALQLDPNSTFALQHLGDSLRIVGRHEEAIAALHRAARIDPEDVWCQIYLGIAQNSAGQHLEATRTFEPLRQHAANDGYGERIRQESKRVLNAALAALQGQSSDHQPLDDDNRDYLSDQALGWLQFRVRQGLTEIDPVLKDPQFAVVREEKQLSTLPRESRDAWKKLWRELSQTALSNSHHERNLTAATSSTWHVLNLVAMSSVAGADLNIQEDQSILVSGVHQANDDYTLEATIEPMRISALKLEVLADPSLPNQGPGRHDSGNFQLAVFDLR